MLLPSHLSDAERDVSNVEASRLSGDGAAGERDGRVEGHGRRGHADRLWNLTSSCTRENAVNIAKLSRQMFLLRPSDINPRLLYAGRVEDFWYKCQSLVTSVHVTEMQCNNCCRSYTDLSIAKKSSESYPAVFSLHPAVHQTNILPSLFGTRCITYAQDEDSPCIALYWYGVMCSKPWGGTSQYL